MKFARIINNTVQEVIDFDPIGRFHPDIAALFVIVQDEVNQGSILNDDGEWEIYVAPEKPAPPPIDINPLIDAAISKTYSDIDKIILEKVGFRSSEYAQSEADAISYKNAGYAGYVSEFVSSFAANNPTLQEQTNQWAADAIIYQANALRSAQLAMRNMRFEKQKLMRMSFDINELKLQIESWDEFIENIRHSLGLSNS